MAYYANKHCIVLCTCDLDGDPDDGWFDVGSWEPINIPFTGQQGPTAETDGLGPGNDPVAFIQQFLTDAVISPSLHTWCDFWNYCAACGFTIF